MWYYYTRDELCISSIRKIYGEVKQATEAFKLLDALTFKRLCFSKKTASEKSLVPSVILDSAFCLLYNLSQELMSAA